MPLEISEIGIHVRVPDGQPGSVEGKPRGAAASPDADAERARLVDDCVRRVLQVLAARGER